MIRIAIVVGHPGLTDVLASTLARSPDIEVAWTADSLEDTRRLLAIDGLVDVVLPDFSLPDGPGLSLLRRRRVGPPAFLMLSSWQGRQYAITAFKRGAAGCLLMEAPLAEIVAAIHHCAAGELAFEPHQLISVAQ